MIKGGAIAALAASATMVGSSRHVAAQPASPAIQDGMEVLTRGPLHEAFAETITFDPEPGIVISEAPPNPIEEVAPDHRPEGANVAWIPGYWGWDDERSDFLWISGIWRSLPPGRQWVPGYWGESQQGFQWTSGYWADAAASEIDYLPEPPASVESGPNIAAPSADDIWLPGVWIWQQNRYAWRPGSWAKKNQDWDWVPDHYVWTPRGYVFVDGYYDYSVPRRGVVFAPVYFNGGLRTQQGFTYSPSTVIRSSVFVRHLFLRPGYGHYYFGDYYGSNYANAGFSPWFSYASSRQGYDPIYANQRWQHRGNHEWEQRAEANYRNLQDNENARPPRNWAAQAALAEHRDASNRRNVAIAAQLEELARRNNGRLRYQQVDPSERQQYGQRGQEYRNYLQQRQKLEAHVQRTAGTDPAIAAGPSRRTFSRSPFVAPSVDQLGKAYSPPQRHQFLKPDLQVQPQPRIQGGPPRARSNSRSGTAGRAEATPQLQPRRQGVNQGNRQGDSARKPQRRGENRGDDSPGAANGQQQTKSENKPEKESKE
jgi:hypothetical protein